jgi:hypothetical protein
MLQSLKHVSFSTAAPTLHNDDRIGL